jgi:hypothetical protein
MTSAEMIAALASAGITTDEEIFDQNLISLSLEDNANLVYGFLSQGLTFDTTNELVKVKEYFFKVASSPFYKATRLSAGSYKIDKDLEGSFSKRVSPLFRKFRNPKPGDIVFSVSIATGNFVQATSITQLDVFEGTMTLEDDIDLSSGRLCYADGEELEIVSGAIEPKTAGDSATSFIGKDSILILRRPVTANPYETVISFENIESLLFRRYNSTESLLLIE